MNETATRLGEVVDATEPVVAGTPIRLPVFRRVPELMPCWTADTVHGETLMAVERQDGRREARLLLAPSEIVRVETATGVTVFREGRDYTCEGNLLHLPPGSRIPCVTMDALTPPADQEGLPSFIRLRGRPDRGLLFSETGVFHKQQICVTYRHTNTDVAWFTPRGGDLPRTRIRLANGDPLVLGVSGDSIALGANASKCMRLAPYHPPFAEWVTAALASRSRGTVSLVNRAVGGWTSAQGLEAAGELAALKPDLVIIAYGMNDNVQLEADEFQANVRGIVDRIRGRNPDAEFVLVSGMCGNPDWELIRPDRFLPFRDALLDLREPGIVCADITSIWIELMQRKRFIDLTGNGVNHPNDFVHRLYAHVILDVLLQSHRARAGGEGN